MGLFMKKNLFLSVLILFYASNPATIHTKSNNDLDSMDKGLLITYMVVAAAFMGLGVYSMYQERKNAQSNTLWSTFQPGQISENFNSVAGAHEAKQALDEIVQFLKNPEYASRLGAKMPTGIILTGNPGTGKTLLARAVAGEANCTFISVSGSIFEEVYTGLGAARVRALFTQAEQLAGPCIIFIDEIDAVGSKRSHSHTLHQTLNQLLTCMDGFSSKTRKHPIIIIGATNHESILDSALLRPGRFDRIINVALPGLSDRIELLKIHLKNIICADDLNLEVIAKQTARFSGADLAQLVNQATLIATKNHQDAVTMKNFEDAINIITLGIPDSSIKMSAQEKRITAYHEAGHTLLHILQPETTAEFYSVTIVPRTKALGLTAWFFEENKHTLNKKEALAKISVLLAGRAAEEFMFGEIGAGAHSDFEQASSIAFHMICSYGMSKLGKRIYDVNYISDVTRQLIDQEINIILEEQYQKTMDILKTNQEKLTLLAERLLEKETLYAAEVYEILEISELKAQVA